MRIEIEIPKEFEPDCVEDKFKDFFSRVLADIKTGDLCGRYEREIAEMFMKAFDESKVAYDVEAVVAELEKRKEKTDGCFDVSCGECKYKMECLEGESEWKVTLDKAISIVRNGGKE